MLRRVGLYLLLAGLAKAQIANLTVERYVLPNGMELLMHVDRKAPIVHVDFRYRVGAKDEKPGRSGFAHLFEHLAFQGPDPANDFTVTAAKIGATGINGETQYDYTEFYETVPSSRLERILWMESNRFAFFLNNVTQQNLDRQRDVVINEKRQGAENEPYGRLNRTIFANLFPPGHPYQHDLAGEDEDLRAATLEDARAFYTAYYTPDRMTLAVAGDFDPDQLKTWTAKYFGSMAPGGGLVEPTRSSPMMQSPRVVEMEDRVRVERVHFVWPAPAMSHRDEAALEFAAYLLAHGASHAFPLLTEKLSLGVSTGQSEHQDASFFQVFVSVAPGAPVAAIEEKMMDGIATLARTAPSAEKMARARNYLESTQVGELETITGMVNAMQRVRSNYGDIGRWGEWAARYSTMTPDDVRAAVNRWLNTPNHLTVHIRPQPALHASVPEPDRKMPPPFQPEKPYHAPEVQSAKLPNGLQIFLIERHDLPKVAVQMRFRVGVMQSPPGKPGLPILMAATTGKATTTRDRDQIDREFEDLASALHGGADLTSQVGAIEVLRKNFEPAFRLFADVVRNARYPEYIVEAQKKDVLDEMEKPDADLDFTRPMLAIAFGDGHPFGSAGYGTAAELRSITAKDVSDFQASYWKPDVAGLFFAGDITMKEAVAAATEHFGNWTGTAGAAPPPPPAKPKAGRLFVVDRKGATQTMVVQVVAGIPLDSPDYAALFLVDRILGGSSGSRLGQNIRQDKGIAYYATSQLGHFPGTGLWVSFSPVQVDRTAVAVREFQKELRGLGGEKPITAAELESAKGSYLRALPETYETLSPALNHAGSYWGSGLPPGELRSMPERVAVVTLDEANAVARKYARADRAFFVLVGDLEKIEPQLRDLGLGTMQIVK